MNVVLLYGRVGQDPKLTYSSSGTAFVNLSLAINERYKQDGEMKEKTYWPQLVASGPRAELLAESVRKGHRLLVAGKLTTRKWDDAQGVTHYATEVWIDRFQFIEKKEGAGDGSVD